MESDGPVSVGSHETTKENGKLRREKALLLHDRLSNAMVSSTSPPLNANKSRLPHAVHAMQIKKGYTVQAVSSPRLPI